MASLPKGKQMAQRRLGLYRQVPQGCKSDTSTELPGVRQIQACAKTNVVPLPLAPCLCSSVKGCSGHWASASNIPAPGNSQVWHRVRANGFVEVCPSDRSSCTHCQWFSLPEREK